MHAMMTLLARIYLAVAKAINHMLYTTCQLKLDFDLYNWRGLIKLQVILIILNALCTCTIECFSFNVSSLGLQLAGPKPV